MTIPAMTFINLPVTNVKASTAFYEALAHGGGEPRPAADPGFMYQRTITDPDGYRWEPFFMDMAQAPKG